MRLIFMGTSEFALPSLERLAGEHEVVAVFTKPDKPAHRGMKLKKGIIKAWAEKHRIPVFTPSRLDTQEASRCREADPHCIVVVSYGLKIPREILDIPPLGAVNAHASLLPKYRGSSPVNAVILNGERKSGVTVFRLNEEWDAGDILLQKEIPLDERETASSLWEKLRRLSAEALSEALAAIDEIT
ncbi:MAG TPA: methionyl-tRNA formyltransferase, partial [Firmicutes bacterium]|nr:methionyl-tRNA formyltransferase [Bacillota bacterium]